MKELEKWFRDPETLAALGTVLGLGENQCVMEVQPLSYIVRVRTQHGPTSHSEHTVTVSIS